MTTNNNKEAYKQAEKELQDEKIKEIKDVMKSILQEIEDQKGVKTKAEDKIRLLKLDLDDLREGKIDQIKERRSKSVIHGPQQLERFISVSYTPSWPLQLNQGSSSFWANATSGTYLVADSGGNFREFYF